MIPFRARLRQLRVLVRTPTGALATCQSKRTVRVEAGRDVRSNGTRRGSKPTSRARRSLRTLAALAARCTLGVAPGAARVSTNVRTRALRPVGSASVYLTTLSLRAALSRQPGVPLYTSATGTGPVISVNANIRYQSVSGFGAAMSDSATWLLYSQLTTTARAQVFMKLFGAAGVRMNFLRVPMGASDFTATGRPYSYDDMPAGQSDPTLAHCTLAHDLPYVIPALRAALSANRSAVLLATPVERARLDESQWDDG